MKIILVLLFAFFQNGCLTSVDEQIDDLRHSLRILRRKFDVKEKIGDMETSFSMCFSALTTSLQSLEKLLVETKDLPRFRRDTAEQKTEEGGTEETTAATEIPSTDIPAETVGPTLPPPCPAEVSIMSEALPLMLNRMAYISDQVTASKLCSICSQDRYSRTCASVCKPKSCMEIVHYTKEGGEGVFEVYPPDRRVPIKVYCDLNNEGGGWTVIHRYRKSQRRLFDRTWDEYRNGFGDPEGVFWVGNEKLYLITKEEPMDLIIEIPRGHRREQKILLESFQVDSEENSYRIHFAKEVTNKLGLMFVNNTVFVTKDRDAACNGCAYQSGWWYGSNSTLAMSSFSSKSDDLYVVKIRPK